MHEAGDSAADHRSLLRRLALTLALSIAPVALWQAQAASPRPVAAKVPALARSCIIKPPDIAPLFPSPVDAAEAKSKPDEDSDDASVDDEDDEDEDEDDEPGLILPSSATCLAISGTVTAGLQYDSYRVPQATSAVPPPGYSWLPNASLRIATSHDLASGLRVGTAFEMSIAPTSGQPDTVTVDEATVTLGTMTFGLATSRFSFWTADEFAFSARLPSRNAGMIAWERDLTERWNLALALEDPTLATTSTVPTVNGRVPDGIARLTYVNGPLTVHLAGALRDVPVAASGFGYAGIIGATYEVKLLGRPGEVTAQIASAVNGAPYIGSSLDATIVRQILLPADSTRGFSAVIAARREWTDEWASNIYVSRYQISVPFVDQSKGKLRIDRIAANLVWTPVEGFKAGIEGSIAHTNIAIANRVVPATLGGRLLSAQLFVERAF
ncbi:hypothetical protein [Bosea sp. 124]|uniref:hypothetical protein n=1 Tax=Bosea sp. 124 TaxID=2135642 RepID=UPI000D3A55D5|nr:hypothetical protein [Bosea sp. 124]PTM42614.1 hypothetical protein C8D03_4207 [Bosea sp. 124]